MKKVCTNCVNCDYVRGFMITCRCSYDKVDEDGLKWHVQSYGEYHKSHANKCEHYSEEKYDRDEVFVL